ncbi:MAG TPA: ferrous iron transport protein B, partial [Bacteroidetes bacterium]|nr:ferrous iron transport protein B [Bacteroidota bacterium]
MIIALAGNPNSGKSSLFNKLTGLRQKTGNFPGVTVEKKSGKLLLPNGKRVTLIDFPGAYSLYPTSTDERIVLSALINPTDENYPRAIVYVADVTHLEKHLLMLTQIKDLGIPCLLALNMSDVAAEKGICVDEKKLAGFLGIPVISVSGRTGKNVDLLKEEMARLLEQEDRQADKASFYPFNQTEKAVVARLQPLFHHRQPYRLKLIAHHYRGLPFLSKEKKTAIAQIVQEEGFQDLPFQINETMQRFDRFVPMLRQVLQSGAENETFTDRLDAVLTHRVWAPVIFMVVMFFVFQAIYAWAVYPMEWIDSGFTFLSHWMRHTLPPGWPVDLLTDGILAGLGGILIFVPQIAILFFLISILEEIGYMARAVYIFDKLMQQFGLNGRSVVALVSGAACAIPAIMSTRTIGNWKERLITILVTPLISCSARIPVYAVLIGFVVPADTVWGLFNMQGLAFMGLYLLGITGALVSAWVFKRIL